jgi:uncharacterized membrane protein
VAPFVVGVGLGGFFDGIVLHQILQWHHLVSSKVPTDTLAGLQANTFADGLFHQAMWLVTLVGVFLLYAQLVGPNRPGMRTLIGGMLIGFGVFNVIDEIVFHVLLELHHIRPGPDYLLYDLGYTAIGVVMIGIGWWLVRREAQGAAAAR